MKKAFLTLLICNFVLAGCSLSFFGSQTVEIPTPTPTQLVVVLTRVPTATNFPKIGTPTPAPPTVTPKPTATPPTSSSVFDDQTLEDLMEGTIAATGVSAQVDIVDERADGGERVANITLVSAHNIDESDLLLKLFVLEVGSALRTLRAFADGTIDADLDATFITVNNKEGKLMGTVKAPSGEINDFLEGKSTVNEALAQLELTGVFESFRE